MTVQTSFMFEPIKSLGSVWNMAFGTAHGFVFPEERVVRLLMVINDKQRWLESLLCVTAPTLSVISTIGKLSSMGIRPVTIDTLFVRHGLLEVAARVALGTSYFRMHAS